MRVLAVLLLGGVIVAMASDAHVWRGGYTVDMPTSVTIPDGTERIVQTSIQMQNTYTVDSVRFAYDYAATSLDYHYTSVTVRDMAGQDMTTEWYRTRQVNTNTGWVEIVLTRQQPGAVLGSIVLRSRYRGRITYTPPPEDPFVRLNWIRWNGERSAHSFPIEENYVRVPQ